jgi:diguanylate cyclase (GGDEF)-like protein
MDSTGVERTDNAALLNAALESMPYGFSIWDDNFRLILVNGRYIELYGLERERVRLGISLLTICELTVAAGNHPGVMPDELFRLYRGRMEATTDPGIINRYEKSIRGRTIRSNYARIPGVGWAVTHEDITDHIGRIQSLHDHQTELRQQNVRFAAAVNNMPQGLCMFDADQRLVICNSAYAELYKLPPEVVRPGTPLTDILAHRIEIGAVPVGGGETYVRESLDQVAEGKAGVAIVELQDGRVISILHHPMDDGGWVSTHQDITEQRQTEMRIRHLARHDSLTDLPNRLMFHEEMKSAETRIRHRQILAVLAIDLDHFKLVNDSLGHAVGDAVLKMVADRLRAACREGDMVARLGGDEFAVLSGVLNRADDAAVLAKRIVARISEPFLVDGHNIMIGASVGIAVAPGDGADTDTLLKNADLALYRAKGEGRSAFHFFEQGMDAALQARHALELELRQAIARGEFRLVFQPLFNLDEKRIVALEALLRWYHPERGTIEPAQFLPVAEETGLIVPIGEWSLHEACRVAVGWPDDVSVAVNVSAVQFRNRNLTQHVKAALEHSGLPPARLELEVTESVLLGEGVPTITILRQLRDLGVRISVDNFGTGYSALSHLRSFPFDKVKIDKSFVHELSSGDDSRAVVEAVIGLSRTLGVSTTAEGVETDAQLDLVRAKGCTEVQGFLFSPPLPADSVDRLFSRRAGLEEWTRALRQTG